MPTPINLTQMYEIAEASYEKKAPLILSDGATVTAAQAYDGVIITNTGASGTETYVLPDARPGMKVTALVRAAQALTIDLATGQSIDGVATSGQTYTADAVGEFLVLICVVDNVWSRIATAGTWTAA